MPTRLAAQWAPLRQAFASQRPRSVARGFKGTRCYGAYTWLTKTSEAWSDDEFFACLPTEPFERASSSTSVPVLLVTPKFAHYLDPTHPFLEKLINKLCTSSPQPRDHMYALAAIVDKIPNVTAASSNPREAEEYEGLSILIAEEEDLKWAAAPPRRIGGPSGEEASLSIVVRDRQTSHNPQGPAHEVGLRLANTVFVNAKERTLLGMYWATNQKGLSTKHTLKKMADLTSCSISTGQTNITSALTLPLYPVGKRRAVITGMGNILRQLSKSPDSTSSEPMPASTELEKDLPRYIEEHNIADKRVSVWALVETADKKIAEQLSSTNDRLSQALRQGAKLHRVMSGGGGWGKKQGLLSLDPEVSFPSLVRARSSIGLDHIFHQTDDAELEMPPIFLENGLIGEDLSHLSQVANPGDYIQFFVSVQPKDMQGALEIANERGSNVSFAFGVMSDIEDADAHCGKEGIISVPNGFGALSEKAITYSQPVLQAGRFIESSTKLDIPGCRVILESQ